MLGIRTKVVQTEDCATDRRFQGWKKKRRRTAAEAGASA